MSAELTEAERKQFERIEDGGDTQGLAWRVAQVKADAYTAGLAARSQLPEGVTVTEWGVRRSEDGEVTTTYSDGLYAPDRAFYKERAEEWCQHLPGYEVVSRQRTTFPDVVTEWAEAGGDRGC